MWPGRRAGPGWPDPMMVGDRLSKRQSRILSAAISAMWMLGSGGSRRARLRPRIVYRAHTASMSHQSNEPRFSSRLGSPSVMTAARTGQSTTSQLSTRPSSTVPGWRYSRAPSRPLRIRSTSPTMTSRSARSGSPPATTAGIPLGPRSTCSARMGWPLSIPSVTRSPAGLRLIRRRPRSTSCGSRRTPCRTSARAATLPRFRTSTRSGLHTPRRPEREA